MPDGVSADGLQVLRLIGDTHEMRGLSVAEQRYQAALSVVSDGEAVTDVAARFGVRRKTLHDCLPRYEAGGLENLANRSHRPIRKVAIAVPDGFSGLGPTSSGRPRP